MPLVHRPEGGATHCELRQAQNRQVPGSSSFQGPSVASREKGQYCWMIALWSIGKVNTKLLCQAAIVLSPLCPPHLPNLPQAMGLELPGPAESLRVSLVSTALALVPLPAALALPPALALEPVALALEPVALALPPALALEPVALALEPVALALPPALALVPVALALEALGATAEWGATAAAARAAVVVAVAVAVAAMAAEARVEDLELVTSGFPEQAQCKPHKRNQPPVKKKYMWKQAGSQTLFEGHVRIITCPMPFRFH